MALSLIDKLHHQAKRTTQDDISKVCKTLEDIFFRPEKAAECMALLRQLFFVLQAGDSEPRIPTQLLLYMLALVTASDKKMMKECLLCQRILQEVLPTEEDLDKESKKLEEKVPSIFHLQVFQGKSVGCLNKLFPTAVRWLQTQGMDFEVQRKAFSFLIGVATLHEKLVQPGKVYAVNDRLGYWLLDVGLYQAPNPYTSNPFRKDENNLVTEMDGTSSTNFFTVLNVGQYYTDDQMMNIYCYSMLYQWIYNTHLALTNYKPEDGMEDSGSFKEDDESITKPMLIGQKSATPTKQLISRSASDGNFSESPSFSPSSVPSSLPVRQTPSTPPRPLSAAIPRALTPTRQSRSSTPVDESKLFLRAGKHCVSEKVFGSLIGRTMDYCFRILDQCDRIPGIADDVCVESGTGRRKMNMFGKEPKVSSDTDLQYACLVETVKLLDLVCKIDSSQIPKAFRELKRVATQPALDEQNPKLLLVILQFLINHCGAIAYDPMTELKSVFHRLLSRYFNSNSVSFDIVLFILDNLESLTFDYKVLASYFPNILKLVAWSPRTFVSDFTDIVPAMMSPATSLEIFHSLLDLPCMTAALEISDKMRNVDFTDMAAMNTDQDPSSSIEAFKNAMYRPMFNFFTRAEGGHGDTINRLDKFHSALQDMMEHPRVLVCYQVVPVLIRVWFAVVLEEASLDFAVELLPVLLERTDLLYGIPEYKRDVKRIISENLVKLLKKYPLVVHKEHTEIIDFLSVTRNIEGRENFFCQLVWAVGEYMSADYSGDCGADTVGKVYEILEVLIYEVIGVTSTVPPDKSPYSIKLVSCLISALSKLASRCQDLIPRAILCLTKVAKQHQANKLGTDQQEILFNRTHELINILKMPNFASVILNPARHLEARPVHRDNTSLASILRGTYRMVAPNV